MANNLIQRIVTKSFPLFIISVVLTSALTHCSDGDEEIVKKPAVTGFTPSKGLPGTIITITGNDFSAVSTENTVKISGINAVISEATPTILKVTVPVGASTGKIEVTVNGHTSVSSGNFIVPPVISSFSPTSAVAGSSIVITGTAFSSTPADNLVTFNGITATVTQASSTSLTVTAPTNGSIGIIAVSVGGETASSTQEFIYLPAFTEFSPTHGSINAVVTIKGSGFRALAGDNQVLFNGIAAEIISGTTTELVVKVPANATTGPVTVIVGGTSIVGNSFEIVVEAVRITGSGFESGYAIAVDGSGNAYVTGSFQGTINLSGTQLVAQGSENIFVAKYNSNSDLVWAKRAGGDARGHGIVVDGDGNSYITGYFSGGDFGSLTANSQGGQDVYIAKLNSAGDFQWVQSFGSPNTDSSMEIILDHEQNLVVVGEFYQTITVGTTDLTSLGEDDIFVAKFNKDSGNAIWAKRFGGAGSNGGRAISYNSDGDLYVAGSFFGTIELNGSTFTAGTILNSFILKLDANGDITWAKEIDGTDWNNTYGITTDAQGNCIITGYFTSSATLGTTVLQASGNEDVFLAKYSAANGNLLWAKKAGGTDYENARAITRDAAGNFYITGYFGRSASFGNMDVTSIENSRDIFVAKYNTDGTIEWIKTAGGEESDGGEAIAVSSTGVVYTTGAYRDFPSAFGGMVLQNSGGDDAFLWKIWPD